MYFLNLLVFWHFFILFKLLLLIALELAQHRRFQGLVHLVLFSPSVALVEAGAAAEARVPSVGV